MASYATPLSRWFYQGSPAVGCKVAVYQTGTTTPVAVYSDNALTSPLANPLTGNGNGETAFYVGTAVALRLVVTTADGAPIADLDPVFPVAPLAGFTGTGADLQKLAGVTNGTAAANKALVTDAANSVAGLTAVGTTEGNLSPYATDKNLLTGGDFSTNPWQNGTAFAAAANGTYTADQWQYLKGGSMAHTVTKDADVPTVAQANRLVTASLKLAVTTAQAALAAGDLCLIAQAVEGSIFLPAAQRTFTLSFWVKAQRAGTYCVSFVNAGNDRSYIAEYQVVSALAWEFKTVTVPASPAAGTWNYATGVGLRAHFALGCGATYQAPAGSWQTGLYYASPNQLNAVATAGDGFWLALAQLEKGPAATAFDSRSVPAELARCQRYFEKSFAVAVAPAQNVGNANGAVSSGGFAGAAALTAFPPAVFKVTKRATPTVTLFNPNAANAQARNVSLGTDCTSTAAINVSETGFLARAVTPASTSAGDLLAVHYTADARL